MFRITRNCGCYTVVSADGAHQNVLCRDHKKTVQRFLLELSREDGHSGLEGSSEIVSVFGAVVKRVDVGIADSIVTDVTSSDLPYIVDLKRYEEELMALARTAASYAGRLPEGLVFDGMSFDFHIDKPGERLSYTAEFDEEGRPDSLDVFRTCHNEGETREYVIGLE